MSEARPCALLCPLVDAAAPEPARGPTQPAPPEDESADPVGDGHSDADLAERQHPAPEKPDPGPEQGN